MIYRLLAAVLLTIAGYIWRRFTAKTEEADTAEASTDVESRDSGLESSEPDSD